MSFATTIERWRKAEPAVALAFSVSVGASMAQWAAHVEGDLRGFAVGFVGVVTAVLARTSPFFWMLVAEVVERWDGRNDREEWEAERARKSTMLAEQAVRVANLTRSWSDSEAQRAELVEAIRRRQADTERAVYPQRPWLDPA